MKFIFKGKYTPASILIVFLFTFYIILLMSFNQSVFKSDNTKWSNNILVLGKNVDLSKIKKYVYDISNFGGKMFTSKANYKALNYLKNEADLIIKNMPKNSLFDIEAEIFYANGTSSVTLIGRLSYIQYEMVPSLIITLKPKNKKLYNYCLLSSHYDSVVGSPGASDNLFYTSLLLHSVEFFSKFEKSQDFYCNLVYSFNGAEEAAMIGAHAFTQSHYLKNNISLLLNFDSPGGGERGVLFQSSEHSGEILKTYKNYAPSPTVSVIGEELFKLMTLPVDTDFQIYRKYGNYIGVDIALSGNGHQYHNIYDSPANIRNQAYSTESKNIISFIYGIIKNKKANEINATSKNLKEYVFFDIFGKYMVIYSVEKAFILNTIVIIISFYVIWMKITSASPYGIEKNSKKLYGLLLITMSVYGAFLCSLVFTAIFSMFVSYFNRALSYNFHKWTVILLYGIPAELVFVSIVSYSVNGICEKLFYAKNEPKEAFFICATLFNSIMLLIIGTYGITIKSFYMLTYSSCLIIISIMISQAISKSSLNNKGYKLLYIVLHLALSFLYAAYMFYNFSLIMSNFIPMFDRTPCIVPSELLVASFTAIQTIIVASLFNILSFTAPKSFKIFKILLCCVWIIFLSALIFNIVPPYKISDASKRMSYYHVSKSQFLNNNKVGNSHGYLIVMATDERCAYDYGEKFRKNFEVLHKHDKFWHSSNQFALLQEFETSFFYKNYSEPKMKDLYFGIKKTNVSKQKNKISRISFELNGTGSIIMDVVLPNHLVLINWSYPITVKYNGKSNGNLIYNIIYFRVSNHPLKFWFDIKINNKKNDNFFYIVAAKHFMDEELNHSNFQEFSELPNFVAPVGNVVQRIDYQITV